MDMDKQAEEIKDFGAHVILFNVGGIQGFLRLIPPDRFGSPEECYYRKVSDGPAFLFGPARPASSIDRRHS
jgi:hypothetical protein